jgi:hypothetical protein
VHIQGERLKGSTIWPPAAKFHIIRQETSHDVSPPQHKFGKTTDDKEVGGLRKRDGENFLSAVIPVIIIMFRQKLTRTGSGCISYH